MNLRREIKGADIRNILLCVAVSVVLCVVSSLFWLWGKEYYLLLMPVFALPMWLFGLLRILIYAVAGASTGLILGNCDTCRRKSKITGIIISVLLLLVCCLRTALIFGSGTLLFGFILSLAALVLNFFAIRYYVRISLISGFGMLAFLLWNIYVAILSFCILILN